MDLNDLYSRKATGDGEHDHGWAAVERTWHQGASGRKAAHLAALNVLAVTRQHLGSLDKVTRIVRLGVSVAASGDVREQPKVADAASELLQDVFGKDKSPCHLVYGVASLPLGTPVELEIIFEVAG
jgi:enamine deaminase RidA (YjgF/YER057c/UK114 family)